MAKIAFKDDKLFARKLKFADKDGETLIVTHDPELGERNYPVVIDTKEIVGLSRKQAVKLAEAILKEVGRG